MTNSKESRGRREQVPALCRRYATARFALLQARSGAGESVSSESITWALGGHADGDYDLLGAWPLPREVGCSWTYVMDELADRGIERIDWAFLPGEEAIPVGRRAGWPIVGQWLTGPSLAAPVAWANPRLRQLLAEADALSKRLQASLMRASRRRGGQFESVEAAEACLSLLWQRQMNLPKVDHEDRSLAGTRQLARVPVRSGIGVSARLL